MSIPHTYVASGFILRKQNVRDADRMLTILTREYGKIHVLAKGVRRITSRRAGHLDVFSHVRITLHKGKSIDLVTEAYRLDSSLDTANFTNIATAYILCELVDKLLPDHQEQRDVYELLEESLSQLGAASISADKITDEFTTSLLRVLGYIEPTRKVTGEEAVREVERIIEKKLRSRTLLTRIPRSTTISK